MNHALSEWELYNTGSGWLVLCDGVTVASRPTYREARQAMRDLRDAAETARRHEEIARAVEQNAERIRVAAERRCDTCTDPEILNPNARVAT